MPKIVSFTRDQRMEIVARYNDGLTVADLARMFSCSVSPILRILRDHDVPMRTPGDEMKATRNQKIIDLKENGYSDQHIAKTLGISRQRVHQIITRGY